MAINLPKSYKLLIKTLPLIHCHLTVLCYSGLPRRPTLYISTHIKKAKTSSLPKPVRIKVVADKGIKLTAKAF